MSTDEARRPGASLLGRPEDETVSVAPGTLTVLREAGRLATVAGSGVAVCLFDRRSRIAGMNHFLFPRAPDPHQATARYGDAALIGLYRLLRHDEPQSVPEAYVAGGAFCDEFELDAALENIRIAWRFLLRRGIPVIASRLGGQQPWQVCFDVAAGTFTACTCASTDAARRQRQP
jgi:chemotaxis protein CheD